MTNSSDDTVSKLRASDGAPEGTFPVGIYPNDLVFDGANIWVLNNTGTVTKLRANDGRNLGEFFAGNNPLHLAYDGSNMWVTSYQTGSVNKLRASDGTLLGTFSVGDYPIGVAFDGTNIWVSVHGESKVSKLRPSDGTILYDKLVLDPEILLSARSGIWIAQTGFNSITSLTLKGDRIRQWNTGQYPVYMAYDGKLIWTTCLRNNRIDGLRAPNGVVRTIKVDTPLGIAFDGSNLWVTNYESDTVSKIVRPVR